jgi:membrane protein implicated in regulation of membrane protease activity
MGVAKRARQGLSFWKALAKALEVAKTMLKNARLILIALAILLAAVVVWAIVGFVVMAVKVLFVLAVVLFIASMVSKLSKRSKPDELEDKGPDRELNEAMRQIEEIKRRQLIK